MAKETRTLRIGIVNVLQWFVMGGGTIEQELIDLAARVTQVDMEDWDTALLSYDDENFIVTFNRDA